MAGQRGRTAVEVSECLCTLTERGTVSMVFKEGRIIGLLYWYSLTPGYFNSNLTKRAKLMLSGLLGSVGQRLYGITSKHLSGT